MAAALRQQLGCLFTVTAASLLLAFLPHLTYASQRTPVEVWRTGDDGLTLKISEAVETAFRASPAFILSSGRKSGTLIVTLPTNVDWKRVGKRTQVQYSVQFTSIHEEKLGSKAGVCWENSPQDCAAQIVKAAVTAANRLRVAAGNSDGQ